MNCLDSLSKTKIIVEDWRRTYNEFRPHTALKALTPVAYARQHQPKLAVVQ
ncbi:MAG: transposase [Candidatus Omnitrophica bacterium]|nr:transposase [Candidatus Omnitrophota bacterium]